MLPHRMIFELKHMVDATHQMFLGSVTHMADATQSCHDSRRFHSGSEEVAALRSENNNRLLHPKKYFSVLLERSFFCLPNYEVYEVCNAFLKCSKPYRLRAAHHVVSRMLPGFNVHRWCHASIVKVLYKYALCPKRSPPNTARNTKSHL